MKIGFNLQSKLRIINSIICNCLVISFIYYRAGLGSM